MTRTLSHLALQCTTMALACSASLHATAQSAYTMTVLNKPAGVNVTEYLPISLDQAGVVRGGMQYATLPTFALPGQPCVVCAYMSKPVSWAATTAASITPVLGSRYLFPLLSNDKGTLVGSYNKATTKPVFIYTSDVFPMSIHDTYLGTNLSQTMAMRKGSTDTLAPITRTGLPKRVFTASAMNSLDWVVGVDVGTVTRGMATTWRDGVITDLAIGTYNASGALGINDSGVVAGYVERNQPPPNENGMSPTTLPAVWANGQLSWVGDDTLAGYKAVAINNAGEALLSNGDQAFLERDGTLTPVAHPANDKVIALGLNKQGAVVGCHRTHNYRGIHTAFIWRNGVMTDLLPEITAKGVTLPAGMALGCPVAINDSGSILTHYTGLDYNSLTWVRLNAKN